ncbi:MAG: SAM-dependent methyltransferase [Acidimicrobiales bacterium]
MGFYLDDVVPWGRRFEEYRAMFALSNDDLTRRLLGCGDGPASFNAEATAAGVDVVSVDPIYAFSAADIRARVDSVFDDMVGQTAANAEDFTWGRGVDDLDDLVDKRRTAMETFLGDFEAGRAKGRYLPGELPRLSFADRSFDLAVCSHLLFLYGEQLSTQFHVDSVAELCRIAREVRIFPLLELGSVPSRHLPSVRSQLDGLGITTRIELVEYEFQRGGNQILVASASVD